MAANYSLSTAAIWGHSGPLRAITGHYGRSPIPPMALDRWGLPFSARSELRPAGAAAAALSLSGGDSRALGASSASAAAGAPAPAAGA